MRFIDEEGNVIENGSEKQPALLAWGGPIVMEGYYNDSELTAKTVVDGYVMTNDLGYMDEDGSIILVGLWWKQDLAGRGRDCCNPVSGCGRLCLQFRSGSDHRRIAGYADRARGWI